MLYFGPVRFGFLLFKRANHKPNHTYGSVRFGFFSVFFFKFIIFHLIIIIVKNGYSSQSCTFIYNLINKLYNISMHIVIPMTKSKKLKFDRQIWSLWRNMYVEKNSTGSDKVKGSIETVNPDPSSLITRKHSYLPLYYVFLSNLVHEKHSRRWDATAHIKILGHLPSNDRAPPRE